MGRRRQRRNPAGHQSGQWRSASPRSPDAAPPKPGARSRRPGEACPPGASAPAKERAACNAQVVQPDDGSAGRPGADHDPGTGQAAGRVARRNRLRRQLHRVVRRRRQAHLRRHHSRSRRTTSASSASSSRRRGRLHYPVELPQRDADAQDRPGARRRLHRGLQARQRHAAVRLRLHRTGRARRHPAGRHQHGHRRNLGDRQGTDVESDWCAS